MAGAAAWLPAVPLSPNGVTASDPDVAVAANGTVAAVWRQGTDVVAAVRPPGRGFGAPQTLASDGTGAPRIATSPNGTAIAIWATVGGVIVNRSRAPGGGFGAPATLSQNGGSDPDVAINARGASAKAWHQTTSGGAEQVHVTVRTPGVPGDEPMDFDTSPDAATQISVALDDEPKPVVAVTWNVLGEIQGAVRPASGTWQPLTPLGSGLNPSLALNIAGNATAVWNDGGGGIDFAGGTTFAAGKDLANGEGAPVVASNAADPSGATLAAWPDNGRIRLARRVGSQFAAPTFLSPAGGVADAPTLSVNPRGRIFGAWIRSGRAEGIAGGAAAQPLSSPSATASSPIIASDGQGDAAAIFLQGGQVFVAGFDGAPPTLNSVSVPPITPLGSPVGMAAAPFDIWSSPSVRWSFGDGRSGAGPTTSHVYRAPGIYTVTVSASDGARNGTTTTRAIAAVFPDRDGDRFPSNLDCNDANARIHPGARDIPGDRIDQDCNGRDAPFPRVAATISYSFDQLSRSRYRLTLLLVKGANRRMTITARCSGKPKCRFTRKRGGRPHKGKVNLLKKLSRKQRLIRAGQTLDVRVTRKGHIGKVLQVRFRDGKRPIQRNRCLRPGSSRPRNSCS